MRGDNGTWKITGKEQFNPSCFMSEQNHFTHIEGFIWRWAVALIDSF